MAKPIELAAGDEVTVSTLESGRHEFLVRASARSSPVLVRLRVNRDWGQVEVEVPK